jgi:predicted transcriptional regulator
MLNIELAVLQNLDHDKWWSLSEISEKTRIQETTAKEALQELDLNGIVESRTHSVVNHSSMEWRSTTDSISNYLQGKVPA